MGNQNGGENPDIEDVESFLTQLHIRENGQLAEIGDGDQPVSERAKLSLIVSEDSIVHLSSYQKQKLEELLERYNAKPDWNSEELRSFMAKLKKNHDMNEIREAARTGKRGKIQLSDIDVSKLTEKALVSVSSIDKRLKEELQEADKKGKRKLEDRAKLPAYGKREEIIRTIKSNQVTLISGDTGCGKTTQVPQFILDDQILDDNGSTCKIVCSQPRRLNAISVAERVANERGELLGEDNCSVGYQIRFYAKKPRQKGGSIMYCTTGVILNWLKDNPLLHGYSHVLLDEVHERDKDIDILMLALKEIIHVRPEFRVILMSATLKEETFLDYFDCTHLKIPGETFPIQTSYLEDILETTGYAREHPFTLTYGDKRPPEFKTALIEYLNEKQYSTDTITYLDHPESERINPQLIVQLLMFINKSSDPGAVLIFLPGWADISHLLDMIEDCPELRNLDSYALHSDMTMNDQKSIFDEPAEGRRKVVVSTNVAETSITIPDVVFVIDSGLAKVKHYDPTENIDFLKTQWEAQTNAKQRKGRAGRVRPGVCYKLYTKPREDRFEDCVVPEMRRSRLDNVILTMKSIALGKVESFFNSVITPPNWEAIEHARRALIDMNAIDDKDEQLTLFGYNLSRIPTDLKFARMIMYGLLLGCLNSALSIVSALDSKDPFHVPRVKGKARRKRKRKEMNEAKKRFACGSKSDHIMFCRVQDAWLAKYEESQQQENPNLLARFERVNFLKHDVLEHSYLMKEQIAQLLHRAGFIATADPRDREANVHSQDFGVIRAVLCAGLCPNIIQKNALKEKKHSNLSTRDNAQGSNEKTQIHVSSVNHDAELDLDDWIVYYKLLATPSRFLFDTSTVSELAMCLFGHCYEPSSKLKTISNVPFKRVRLGREERSHLKVNVDVQLCDQLQKLRHIVEELLNQCLVNSACLTWANDSKEAIGREAIALVVSAE